MSQVEFPCFWDKALFSILPSIFWILGLPLWLLGLILPLSDLWVWYHSYPFKWFSLVLYHRSAQISIQLILKWNPLQTLESFLCVAHSFTVFFHTGSNCLGLNSQHCLQFSGRFLGSALGPSCTTGARHSLQTMNCEHEEHICFPSLRDHCLSYEVLSSLE